MITQNHYRIMLGAYWKKSACWKFLLKHILKLQGQIIWKTGSFSWMLYYNSCNSLSCSLQEGSAASQKLPNTLRNTLQNVAPTSLLECFGILVLLLRLEYCSDLYSYAKLSTYQACETWFFAFSVSSISDWFYYHLKYFRWLLQYCLLWVKSNVLS